MNIQSIIEVIKEISENPLCVYIGEGEIDELGVTLHKGLNKENYLERIEKFPEEYVQLLEFSNGMQFFECGDISFYSLEEVLSTQEAFGYKENIYPIGYVLGDQVLLILDDSKQGYQIYVEAENISDDMVLLGGTFVDVMEKFLLCGCNNFWYIYSDYKRKE